MNYSDLNKTQKRVIDAYIAIRPELADTKTITRPEVEELHFKLFAERANGGAKIGYPMWLVKGDRTSRGVYLFPAPNVVHDSVPLPKPVTQKQMKANLTKTQEQIQADEARVAEDEEFFAELREHGVMA